MKFEKVSNFMERIRKAINKIDNLYLALIVLFILVIVAPQLGLFVMLCSIVIIFITIDTSSHTATIVFLGVIMAMAIYAPGQLISTKKVDKIPATVKEVGDKFVASYVDHNQIKLKTYSTIPKCDKYQMYRNSSIYRLIITKYTIKSRLKLGCVK